MARSPTILTLVAAAALATGSPSAAAPPWEPYREAQVPGCDCVEPWQFAFGASGGAVAVAASPARAHPYLATRQPSGVWAARQGPRVGDARLGVYGDRAMLLGTIGSNPRVTLASGRVEGTFGAPRSLGPGQRPALAVDPSGAAGAAWARDGSIVAMRRSAGRAFGRPLRLGREDRSGNRPAVAVNRHGDAVVVWRAANHRTFLTPIHRNGQLGTRLELGRSDGVDLYAAALGADGRWVAAWLTERRSTGRRRPPSVSVFTGSLRSVKVRGGRLDSLQESVPGSRALHARVDSNGNPIVAWTSSEPAGEPFSGERRIVRYVMGTSGGALGQPETIRVADRNSFFADLETGPRGTAVLLWTTSYGPSGSTGPQPPPELHARHRGGSDQAFGPDERLDDLVGVAAVAFDPTSGRPLAIWDSLRESFRG